MPSLLNRASSSMPDVFKIVRDFVCKRGEFANTGIGWTLHDAVYAVDENNISLGDYVIFYSPSSSGVDHQYIYFEYDTTARFYAGGYNFWNKTNHTGTRNSVEYLNINNMPITAVWISGDIDQVFITVVTSSATYVSSLSFGYIKPKDNQSPFIQIPAAVTVGANKILTFTEIPSWFEVGRTIVFRDEANVSGAKISDINGNNVTFATLSYSFTASAVLKRELPIFCSASSALASAKVMSDFTVNPWASLNRDVNPATVTPINTGVPARDIYLANAYTLFGPIANIKVVGNVAAFAQGSAHIIGADQYRYFGGALIKEM